MKKLLLLTLLLIVNYSFSQKKINIPVSSEGKSNNGIYTYKANVEFQVRPEGLLVDVIVARKVTNYEITSYTYKNINATEVGYTFPIKVNSFTNKAFVDIQFYKGTVSYTARNLQPNGSTYLSDSQLKNLFNTFNIDPKKRDCITCDAIKEVKQLNIKAYNVRLEDLGYKDIFSEINTKIDKFIREKKEKEKNRQKVNDIKNQINSLGNTKENLQEKKSLYQKLDSFDTENEYSSEINNIEEEIENLNKKEEEKEKQKLKESESSEDEESDEEKEENLKEAAAEKERNKVREKQETEERERKRKEEAERLRKEKIKAYNDRIENQRKENNAIAASVAASSASVLYLLGGIIYDRMGLPAKDLYTGNNFHVNFDFGYGVSVFPIANNSVKTGIDFNGNNTETTNNDPSTALTIDLRLALKFGYEMEYGGGNIYGRFEPGFSPIFTDFNTSYGYGAEIFGGHKNIKLYGRYESGSHNFSSSNWIDPEEVGEGGKSSTKYQQIRAGLKFSFYKNSRTAKRDHLIIGIMENYFDENSSSIFGIRENPDKPILNLLSTPSEADMNPYIATGYFFEWKRDHTHRLYIELFPNYPVTGEIGGGSSEGKFFMQVGFSRSIEGFFGKK